MIRKALKASSSATKWVYAKSRSVPVVKTQALTVYRFAVGSDPCASVRTTHRSRYKDKQAIKAGRYQQDVRRAFHEMNKTDLMKMNVDFKRGKLGPAIKLKDDQCATLSVAIMFDSGKHPDATNVLKLIEDALFQNDNRVMASVEKIEEYAPHSGVFVIVIILPVEMIRPYGRLKSKAQNA